MPVDPSKLKRLVVEELLAREPYFRVVLDPRYPKVEVPSYLRRQEILVLHVGQELAVPILDLLVSAWGITGTLSFGRETFHCRIPWGSVLGVELLDRPLVAFARDAASVAEVSPARGGLRLVKGVS